MTPNNPLPSPPAGMARARPLRNGWLWWKQAWRLALNNWDLWSLAILVLLVIMAAINLASLLVPVVGSLVPALLTPVFAAGLFHIAQRRWRGEEFQFRDLFMGFSRRTGALLVAGVAQLLVQVAIIVVIGLVSLLLFGMELFDAQIAAYSFSLGGGLPPLVVDDAVLIKGLLVSLVTLALVIPYMAALWFQVPLVYLAGRNPFVALWQSLRAVVINWLPMLWYGVIPLGVVLVLALLAGLLIALINMMLGEGVLAAILYGMVALVFSVGALFLSAVCVLSIFTAFQDIFAPREDGEPVEEPEREEE